MGKFSPMQIANAVAKKADKLERFKTKKKAAPAIDDEDLEDEADAAPAPAPQNKKLFKGKK